MLPILERFAAHIELRSECFLGQSVSNPVQSKMLRKQLTVSGQRVRIHPYGPEHEMAKRVRNGPLPPTSISINVYRALVTIAALD